MTIREEFQERYDKEKIFREAQRKAESLELEIVARKWTKKIAKKLRKKIKKAMKDRSLVYFPARFAVEVTFFQKGNCWCIKIDDTVYESDLIHISRDEINSSMNSYLKKKGIKKEGQEGTNIIKCSVSFV